MDPHPHTPSTPEERDDRPRDVEAPGRTTSPRHDADAARDAVVQLGEDPGTIDPDDRSPD